MDSMSDGPTQDCAQQVGRKPSVTDVQLKHLQRLLRIYDPRRVDYVNAFQAFTAHHLVIRRQGPTAENLLEKCRLLLPLGRYKDAVSAAIDAEVLHANSNEVHYLMGVAYYLNACHMLGITQTPHREDFEEPTSAEEQLRLALGNFHIAHEASPGDEDVATIELELGSIAEPTQLLVLV